MSLPPTQELPFPLHAVLLRVTGRTLRGILEQQVGDAPCTKAHYPHVSAGLRVLYHSEKPVVDEWECVRGRTISYQSRTRVGS